MPERQVIHIINDLDEPDEILEVPEGMDKTDYVFGKVLGGFRKLNRNVNDTCAIANLALETANDAKVLATSACSEIRTCRNGHENRKLGKKELIVGTGAIIGIIGGLVGIASGLGWF